MEVQNYLFTFCWYLSFHTEFLISCFALFAQVEFVFEKEGPPEESTWSSEWMIQAGTWGQQKLIPWFSGQRVSDLTLHIAQFYHLMNKIKFLKCDGEIQDYNIIPNIAMIQIKL